jgi:hypothetical protein
LVSFAISAIAGKSNQEIKPGDRGSKPLPVTPAKAGVHRAGIALWEAWIPAFAGMTM